MLAGQKRIFVARIFSLLAFLCGVLGLLAGVLERTWELGSLGWFAGGALLALIAMFILLDGAIGMLDALVRHR
jgi:hypothetical protein